MKVLRVRNLKEFFSVVLVQIGRLRTQDMQPSSLSGGRKEVDIQLISVQQSVVLMQPFSAILRVQSNVDRRMGPLTMTAAKGGATLQ